MGGDARQRAEIGCVASPSAGPEALRRLRGSSCKDELQGSLDVSPGGLQGAEAQLVVVDAHVSQLLQLGLPLALQGENGQRDTRSSTITDTEIATAEPHLSLWGVGKRPAEPGTLDNCGVLAGLGGLLADVSLPN